MTVTPGVGVGGHLALDGGEPVRVGGIGHAPVEFVARDVESGKGGAVGVRAFLDIYQCGRRRCGSGWW